jgi:hypothetical protein
VWRKFNFHKIRQEQWVLPLKTNIFFLIYLAKLLSGGEMLQTKAVKKIKTHFVFNHLFSENRAIYEIKVEKYRRSGQDS